MNTDSLTGIAGCGTAGTAKLLSLPVHVCAPLLLFCKDGEAALRIDVQRRQLHCGDTCLLPPGCLLAVDAATADVAIQYIYVCSNVFGDASAMLPAAFTSYLQNASLAACDESFRNLFRAVRRLQRQPVASFGCRPFRNILQNYFFEVYEKERHPFEDWLKQPQRKPERLLKRFIELVRADHRLCHSVQPYADKLGVSARYLSLSTNNLLGASPKSLIYDYSVLVAKWMIRHTQLPLQQVAQQLGFSDQCQLNRVFKRCTGLTPTQFRGQYPTAAISPGSHKLKQAASLL